MNRHRSLVLVLLAFFASATLFGAERHDYGILLLAHGGAERWNDSVAELARGIDADVPTEVAFGMAQRSAMQPAIDRLQARGVERIVAVPLFVSSHSSVITSTEYLLGLRETAPPQLEQFARMSHGHGGGHGHGDEHAAAADPTSPVVASVPVTMTKALDGHPIAAEILLSRVASLSSDPAEEVVIVVAHGPVSNEDNEKWLADIGSLAEHMRGAGTFHRIEYMTVRDDAPEPIRSQATVELRARVEKAAAEGKRVVIAPLLISYGGIERGIQKRLEGLEYAMPAEGLLPDERLATWVRVMAEGSRTDAGATVTAHHDAAHH
ncbi:MAG: sirohydrochlorin chelatase [Thermoanaerobaculia bacterium]